MKNLLIILSAAFVIAIAFILPDKAEMNQEPQIVPRAESEPLFQYFFDTAGTLNEAEDEEHSTSPYWWLDSGGELIIRDGFGYTISGDLEESNRWYWQYRSANPTDTDDGKHPQNIFRLITRREWENFTQEVEFIVDKYNLSASSNRGESNGLLLVSRYHDEDNLYYAGIRVDGYAVIKKKYQGEYITLIQKKIFPGIYDRNSNPNLLPIDERIGLRSSTQTLDDKTVHLSLYLKRKGGEWQNILETIDTGENYPIIEGESYAGIRTDFMDVRLDNYKSEEL